MPHVTPSGSNAHDHAAIAEAFDNITAGLERVLTGFGHLKSLLASEDVADTAEFDPKDPANKREVGGLKKFTPRGVEICYRLFDAGKSRYAVATAMDISFGAANHRYEAWKRIGGLNRTKQPLD